MLAELDVDKRERLREVIEDPVLFSRGILQHDPWDIPARIMRALNRPHARVAVKACHSSSKTFTAASVVLWWLARYSDGMVVTTAPTYSQVRLLLWQEIRKNIQRSRIKFPEPNLTELTISDGRYALGRSTNEGVNFQGFHGRVLIIIDEAPGVANDIWEAIEGIRAGGDIRILALGNPVVSSGAFYELFENQAAGWELYTIGAFDTPNLKGLTIEDLQAMPIDEGGPLDENERPYLTTRRWVLEKWKDWGPDSPEFQSRVLGRFPTQSRDALISLTWLEEAATRELRESSEGYIAGIDVAGAGKAETVLYVRQGPNVVCMEAWPDADPLGKLMQALEPYRHDLICYVDEIGIGYNFAIRLRQELAGWFERHCKQLEEDAKAKRTDPQYPPEPKVVGVNVGDAPRDNERFSNLKAESYWGIRDRLRDGDVCGLVDARTRGQLASIRSLPNARGQNTIEKKEDAAKRGVPSPDRAEAFMLCFSGEPRPRRLSIGSITGASKWGV